MKNKIVHDVSLGNSKNGTKFCLNIFLKTSKYVYLFWTLWATARERMNRKSTHYYDVSCNGARQQKAKLAINI